MIWRKTEHILKILSHGKVISCKDGLIYFIIVLIRVKIIVLNIFKRMWWWVESAILLTHKLLWRSGNRSSRLTHTVRTRQLRVSESTWWVIYASCPRNEGIRYTACFCEKLSVLGFYLSAIFSKTTYYILMIFLWELVI